ncbi:MAG TPA: hypothetical protein VFC75_02935 [Erysipelothrix sp.]|nr:hypothetical protein [Erysipelothrix sp.]
MKEESSVIKIGVKSAFFMVFSILVATFVFPVLLNTLGLKLYPLRVLVNGLMTGWAFAHTIFIRESNKGYTKGYWIVFILISMLAAYISYFWVYGIYYM